MYMRPCAAPAATLQALHPKPASRALKSGVCEVARPSNATNWCRAARWREKEEAFVSGLGRGPELQQSGRPALATAPIRAARKPRRGHAPGSGHPPPQTVWA